MKGNWTCYMLAWLLAVASVAGADAQTGLYPNKPVQIIADSSAGSTPDVALRFVAEGLTQVWKQQVLVNNHPGAGGSLAVRLAAAAAPDGYTLYQPVLSTFVSLRPAAPNIPIHVPQDFLPIGFVAENPMFIAVSPSLGISTLPELIARAKKAPDEITYATTGVGRLTHLTGELLQREAGIKLLLVPYIGGPSHAVTDVATGRVAMMIEGYSGVAGAARSGSIKLIAVASASPPSETPRDLADFHQRQGHAPRFAGKGRETALRLCRMGRCEGRSAERLRASSQGVEGRNLPPTGGAMTPLKKLRPPSGPPGFF
jgi:tripartite-type tricarboxylate transporter receptor subunit TctC